MQVFITIKIQFAWAHYEALQILPISSCRKYEKGRKITFGFQYFISINKNSTYFYKKLNTF
jgi:hypothetical protein